MYTQKITSLSAYAAIGCSALLYSVSHVCIAYFWWLSLLFLVPLFIATFYTRFDCWHGFFWIILCIIGASSRPLCDYLANAPTILSCAIIIGIYILYCGIHAGILFWLTSLLLDRTKKNHFHIIIWSTTCWLLFAWLSGYSLWIFNRPEGLSLLNPLLPLAKSPHIIWPARSIGIHGTLFALTLAQGIFAYCIAKPTIYSLFAFSVCCSAWLVGIIQYPQTDLLPLWINRVAWIPRSIKPCQATSHMTKKIRNYCSQILISNPQKDIFIFPEDCLPTTHLVEQPKLASLCLPPNSISDCSIIIGAYRNHHKEQYNTAYHLAQGIVQSYSDKRHSMIFAESMPLLCGSTILKQFDTMRIPLLASSYPRSVITIDGVDQLVPYLCSELFCSDWYDDDKPNATILALCSDKWSKSSHSAYCMFLLARLRAITWQRALLYISYRYGAYIDQYGYITPLQDVSEHLTTIDEPALESDLYDQQNILDILTDSDPEIVNIYSPGTYTLTMNNAYDAVCIRIIDTTWQREPITVIVTHAHNAHNHRIVVYSCNNDTVHYLDAISTPTENITLTIDATNKGFTCYCPQSNEDIIVHYQR